MFTWWPNWFLMERRWMQVLSSLFYRHGLDTGGLTQRQVSTWRPAYKRIQVADGLANGSPQAPSELTYVDNYRSNLGWTKFKPLSQKCHMVCYFLLGWLWKIQQSIILFCNIGIRQLLPVHQIATPGKPLAIFAVFLSRRSWHHRQGKFLLCRTV